MSIFESTDVAGYWGATRELRDLAVAIVDRLHGYTIEFASNPAAHRNDYNTVERTIIEALELGDVPHSYSISLQGCIAKVEGER